MVSKSGVRMVALIKFPSKKEKKKKDSTVRVPNVEFVTGRRKSVLNVEFVTRYTHIVIWPSKVL